MNTSEHFWLIFGLLIGLLCGLFNYFNLSKNIEKNNLTTGRIKASSCGWFLYIFLLSFMTWLLQHSVNPAASPIYTDWPQPQKSFAVILSLGLSPALKLFDRGWHRPQMGDDEAFTFRSNWVQGWLWGAFASSLLIAVAFPPAVWLVVLGLVLVLVALLRYSARTGHRYTWDNAERRLDWFEGLTGALGGIFVAVPIIVLLVTIFLSE